MSDLTSIIIPVYNEGDAIIPQLDRLMAEVQPPFEVLVVHDMTEDTTVPFVAGYRDRNVRPVLNTYGPGPANAIRFGLDHASGDVAVVTMADESDDPKLIREMAALVRGGKAVVAASRYMPGGRQIGGPLLKRTLSRLAGVSLYHLAGVGTHDATNSFKAYSTEFVREARVDSVAGFEIGIELVAKAKRMGREVAEVPTTWRDRSEGESRFRVAAWITRYLRWYLYAFGVGSSPHLERMH